MPSIKNSKRGKVNWQALAKRHREIVISVLRLIKQAFKKGNYGPHELLVPVLWKSRLNTKYVIGMDCPTGPKRSNKSLRTRLEEIELIKSVRFARVGKMQLA